MPISSLKTHGKEFKAEFLALMETSFPPSAKQRKDVAWDWLFAFKPEDRKHDAQIVAIERGGETVGANLSHFSRLVINGKRFASMSPMSTVVDPNHRGAGFRIMRTYFRQDGEEIVYGLPNSERLDAMYAKLNAILTDRRRLRRRIYRLGSALAARGKLPGALVGLLDLVARLPLALLGLRAPRLAGDEGFQQIDQFGPEFDAAWAKAEPNVSCAQVRDSAYLTWRFIDAPFGNYECWALRRGADLLGYVVTDVTTVKGLKTGRITDFFAFDGSERTLGLLLAKANAHFIARGCAVGEVAYGNTSDVDNAARACGMVHKKLQRPYVMYHTDPAVQEQIKAGILNYHFTRGDQDEDY